MKKRHKHIGSSPDDFLKEEGGLRLRQELMRRATSGMLCGVLFAFAFALVGQPIPFSIVIQRGRAENGLITGTISVNGQQIAVLQLSKLVWNQVRSDTPL